MVNNAPWMEIRKIFIKCHTKFELNEELYFLYADLEEASSGRCRCREGML